MIKLPGLYEETFLYCISNRGVIIEEGSFTTKETKVSLPWRIRAKQPPNVSCTIYRESTKEEESTFLPYNYKLHAPKFNIPRGNYRLDISWDYVEDNLLSFTKRVGQTIDEVLNPEFQRGHVWTEPQQIAYIEYIFKGGTSGKDVYFNCSGWNDGLAAPVYCVDGLQRITAVRRFMNNEIPAFGVYLKDSSGIDSLDQAFSWHVLDFKEMSEVLQWYVDMNSKGTSHTQEELDKVLNLKKKMEQIDERTT